ncbi:hypothetical protein INN71_12710 [Nocardioides sp. ChNu-153]|uniref:hypothetical protein n=1 Tax=unclassified Nocardioides TaxID=2615069 RepID=UPI002406700F|nr:MULTISPECIES: hypothetical protein [unclassified Nocardioides]MDF9717039.1 hypothetical protein [Nocardioides sp. ChNu-99]MDN7122249.1 hypothetical protein [Nocardioides sp. ChNu-153]
MSAETGEPTELDRLDAAVRAAPAGDTSAQIALWQHVSRLPQWFFIARGSAEQPRPYGVAFDQGPVVCLYSSADRARDAARALGLADGAGDVALYAVPLPAAIDYVAAFQQVGVFGVALDHPQLGHWIPLANLGMLKSWLGGSPG